MTPAGIEPATFRFVAQHLNRCATAVLFYNCEIKSEDVCFHNQSQWPRGLRRGCAVARLLGYWI